MIGTLQALGATYGQIRRIMFWNNLQLVLKGMFWGNLVGIGLGTLQAYAKLIRLDPTYYYIDYVPIAWNGWYLLLLNVLVFLLVTLVLILSIALIAKIRPIRAIRFQ